MQTQVSPPLSNIQYELLKLFSRNIPDKDLLEIRRMLANYFMQKAVEEADKIWDERGYTNDLMNEWLNESREKSND